MKTFKEFTEKSEYANLSPEQIEHVLAENPAALSPVMSRVVIELQELVWKLMKLMYNIVVFLLKLGVGSGKFLYKRYNKQARDDRKFDKQMRRTNKQIKKLKLAKARHQSAVLRLENMKKSLDDLSKEDQIKHKREILGYKKSIKEIEMEAALALKKLQAIKLPKTGMFG